MFKFVQKKGFHSGLYVICMLKWLEYNHSLNFKYGVILARNINPNTRIPFFAPGYEEPSGDDFGAYKEIVGTTTLRAAEKVGLKDKVLRNLFSPRRINEGKGCPYHIWRILLEIEGLEKPVTTERVSSIDVKDSVFEKSPEIWTCPNLSELTKVQKLLGVKNTELFQRTALDVEILNQVQTGQADLSEFLTQEDWFLFLKSKHVTCKQDLFDEQRFIRPETLLHINDSNYEPPTPLEVRRLIGLLDIDFVAAGLLMGLNESQLRFFTTSASDIRHSVRPRKASYINSDNWVPPRHDDLKAIAIVTGKSFGVVCRAVGAKYHVKNELKKPGFSKQLVIDQDRWFFGLVELGIRSFDELESKIELEREISEEYSEGNKFFERKKTNIPFTAWQILLNAARIERSATIK